MTLASTAKPSPLTRPRVHARPHRRFKHMAQDVAIAEAPVAIDRKRRVIRHLLVKIEPAKPSVREMQLDLLAQPSLKPNAVAVADEQHPEHELGIDQIGRAHV